MKTLYIECNMGVAGDMLMGALYELCDCLLYTSHHDHSWYRLYQWWNDPW